MAAIYPYNQTGHYADGIPIKLSTWAATLILRPNKFVSGQSLFDFGEVLRGPARTAGQGSNYW